MNTVRSERGELVFANIQWQSGCQQLFMDEELIFYCRNGRGSQAAATMVTDEEITRKTICHLDGGVMAWEGGTTAGLPRIRLFEDSDSPGETLRTAMDLEKGALKYYTRVHGIYRRLLA